MEKIEIGFAVDEDSVQCAFVAAFSLLSNLTDKKQIIISVFSDKLDKDYGADWLTRFRNLSVAPHEVKIHKIDSAKFRKCKSFFGSYAAYHRIEMPHHASCERFIYADADIIFRGKPDSLLNTCLRGAVASFVYSGRCSERDDREKELLLLHGKKNNDPYYSTGLAVIDVKKYISCDVLDKSIYIAKKYPEMITMYDQTIWNCAIHSVAQLNEEWCQNAFPSTDIKSEMKDGLIHFAGSPKPWDLLAEFFHPYHEVWVEVAKRAGYKHVTLGKYLKLHNYYRAKRISKQYKRWMQ